jgi:hypothetical protein
MRAVHQDIDSLVNDPEYLRKDETKFTEEEELEYFNIPEWAGSSVNIVPMADYFNELDLEERKAECEKHHMPYSVNPKKGRGMNLRIPSNICVCTCANVDNFGDPRVIYRNNVVNAIQARQRPNQAPFCMGCYCDFCSMMGADDLPFCRMIGGSLNQTKKNYAKFILSVNRMASVKKFGFLSPNVQEMLIPHTIPLSALILCEYTPELDTAILKHRDAHLGIWPLSNLQLLKKLNRKYPDVLKKKPNGDSNEVCCAMIVNILSGYLESSVEVLGYLIAQSGIEIEEFNELLAVVIKERRILTDNEEIIKFLVRSNRDLVDHFSFIGSICTKRQFEIIEFLFGPEINMDGINSAILPAAFVTNDRELIEFVLDRVEPYMIGFIDYAMDYCDNEIIKKIIDKATQDPHTLHVVFEGSFPRIINNANEELYQHFRSLGYFEEPLERYFTREITLKGVLFLESKGYFGKNVRSKLIMLLRNCSSLSVIKYCLSTSKLRLTYSETETYMTHFQSYLDLVYHRKDHNKRKFWDNIGKRIRNYHWYYTDGYGKQKFTRYMLKLTRYLVPKDKPYLIPEYFMATLIKPAHHNGPQRISYMLINQLMLRYNLELNRLYTFYEYLSDLDKKWSFARFDKPCPDDIEPRHRENAVRLFYSHQTNNLPNLIYNIEWVFKSQEIDTFNLVLCKYEWKNYSPLG